MKGWESLAYGTQAADASADAATWGSQVATRTSNGASATSNCFCRISRTDV